MRNARKWLVVLLAVSVLSACSLLPESVSNEPVKTGESGELPKGEGWWYVQFHIHRPDGESPRWYMDALLAGEVIAPVFDTHYSDILIWRIHRRASNDDHGHIFSFIFYSNPSGAQRINADIGKNPVLRQLRQQARITDVTFDNVNRISRPGIEDTSDESWPPVVQQTWPALIMGASRMWLDMVGLVESRQPQDTDLEARYTLVNEEISRIWSEQGQHAVLHHLSAVYGYQPLMIRY